MDQMTSQHDGAELLKQVHEKMRVYDNMNGDIGMVDRVYLGAESELAAERGQDPATAGTPDVPSDNLIQYFARVFEPDELPKEIQERLVQKGFVRMNASGILAADRYVTPEQIDHVDEKHVFLNVARKDLIKS
ncbi:MAG: hypothetical protein HY782_03740 [Chloroflexi bacterium]|nr:hypothetical protein [Chloroflexota bacterium]